MSDVNLPPTLLTETEVAKQLRVSLAALRKWRVMKRGPQFLKVGSLVRYRQADVDQWLVHRKNRRGCHPPRLNSAGIIETTHNPSLSKRAGPMLADRWCWPRASLQSK
jgi:excisionase family DNA binding protein